MPWYGMTLTTPNDVTHAVIEEGGGSYVARLGCEPENWVHIGLMLRWVRGAPRHGGRVDCMTCLVAIARD